jgi:hypothetical protein
MTPIYAIVLVVHGLVHLLGFAKAFGLSELPQVTRSVPAPIGVLWLIAALLFLGAAGALFQWPRWWWAIGASAIVVSTAAIVPSWSDAKAGALANLVVLVGVVFGFLAQGPFSLRAAYDRDVAHALVPTEPLEPITDGDLAHLPFPVQRYLRAAAVVGKARVRNFRVRMHGRIRNGPEARWMPFAAEQYSFIDEPARLFYLDASTFSVPVQGYHRYVGPTATMRIKAAALVTVADVSGPEMNRGETVTMFNDMCVMAPATLVDPAVVWEPVDARTARASFTNAGQTIRAELSFNDAAELTDFRSDDRYQTSADGSRVKKVRWSTPLGGYRSFGPVRLAGTGEGRWHEPGREYAYIEVTLDDIQYNVRPR